MQVGSFRLEASTLHHLAEEAFLDSKLRLGINFLSLAAFSPLEARQLAASRRSTEMLADSLGEASPLAKLIEKQLKEGALEQQQPASPPSASTAFSSFWKKQAQLLAASLQMTLADVAALEESEQQQEAWRKLGQQNSFAQGKLGKSQQAALMAQSFP